MSDEREKAIEAIMQSGRGKTREQAVAFLDILGSAFRRRGEIPGEPLSQEQIGERLDTFIGPAGVGENQEAPK